MVGRGKVGRESGKGRVVKFRRGKLKRDCAVVTMPFRRAGAGPLLTLTGIDGLSVCLSVCQCRDGC